jgi:hypothetical protein
VLIVSVITIHARLNINNGVINENRFLGINTNTHICIKYISHDALPMHAIKEARRECFPTIENS